MKKLREFLVIAFISVMVLGNTSCLVRYQEDNGKHRGWYHHHNNRPYRDNRVIVVGQDHGNKPSHNNKIKVKKNHSNNRWNSKK